MWIINGKELTMVLPDNVKHNGETVSVFSMSEEQLDEIGINAAVMVEREPFTNYETEMVKDGMVYRETIVSQSTDGVAQSEHAASTVRLDRESLFAEADKKIMQIRRDIRQAERVGQDVAEYESALEAWDNYCDALCDITKQDEFPSSIDWPTPPTE